MCWRIMRVLVFKLIYLVYAITASLNSNETSRNDNSKYALYFPRNMISEQPSTICLVLCESCIPASLTIWFKDNSYISVHELQKDYSCFDIRVPTFSTDVTQTKLQIELKIKDQIIQGEENVAINSNENVLFIETDRAFYKMGEVVKIRLLVLEYDLMPPIDYKIPSVEISNPSGTTVALWENVTTDLGLAQLEFQLAPETSVGKWSIKASKTRRSFSVEKYVLPRFKVNIVAPESLYYKAEIVLCTVCAEYSYGKNVKGKALLKVKRNPHYYWNHRHSADISKIKDLSNGCAEFNFTQGELDLENLWNINLEASVTEKDTEQVEVGSAKTNVNRSPFVLDISEQVFKAGLPFIGHIKLKDIKIPFTQDTIEICLKTGHYHYDEKICSDFVVFPKNITEFVLPPLRVDVGEIYITGKAHSHSEVYTHKYLRKWESSSNNFIQIKKTENWERTECKSSLRFTIFYTSKNMIENQTLTFYYIVLSRNEIVNVGQIKDSVKKRPSQDDDSSKFTGNITNYFNFEEPVNKFQLDISLDDKIFIDSKLIVYHVFENEVIADKLDFTVQKCFPNKVDAYWSENGLYPGEVTNLNIKTDTNALCAVSSIDKASKFMGSGSSINIQDVFSSYDYMKNRYHYDNLNCLKPKHTTPDYYSYWKPDTSDSSDVFRDARIGVISNLQLLTKMCVAHRYSFRVPYDIYDFRPVLRFSGGGGRRIRPLSGIRRYQTGASVRRLVDSETLLSSKLDVQEVSKGDMMEERGSEIRSYFPETWLWDLVPVKTSGFIKVERKLPDSITNWETTVLCISPQTGIGISDTFEINVFKPFFIDVLLPYSIKRNTEILHLPVTVFNYMNNSLEVRTTLLESGGLVLVDGEKANNKILTIDAQNTVTAYYRIKATTLGHTNVTVLAFPSYSNEGNVPLNRDTVQKRLLVEPEGYRSEIIKSILLCANDSKGIDNVQWELILPENTVADTTSGKIIINSDILGPMFQNLENILMVPTGCGEQTMATLTPNLYVLKYLKANKALTGETKARILSNLKIGYQRILNYVHDDGSFSAFGKSDGEGSMFLTAFVVRTLRQMKEYVVIDDQVITKALRWMESNQLENGCFHPKRHVFHEMGIASSKNQTTALTAYVLISILETKSGISEDVLSKAKECLLHDETSDKYTMAISAYALSLMNETEKSTKKLNKLLEIANRQDYLTWWTQSETSDSANVEVSSYVIMGLLKQNAAENAGIANSVVRWLQSKMNPRGGFFSTVDTVVGLDAISRYALLINTKKPYVNIEVDTKNFKKNISVLERNRIKTDEVLLDTFPNTVKIKANGDGCVFVQASVSFYLQKVETDDAFKLDINIKSLNKDNKCSLMELKPCISYTGPGQSNMAIVEVTMPSGYEPDQTSLYELRNSRDSVLKKFELIRNEVVFYFTQLSQKEICIPFTITENIMVENVANATIKLYDYYKPELAISKSFKIDNCSSTNTQTKVY